MDVSTTIDHKDAVAFPSVTVCNQVESSTPIHLTFLEPGELPEVGGDDGEMQGGPAHPDSPQTREPPCGHKLILEDLHLMGCNATTNKQEETTDNQKQGNTMKKPGVCMKVKTT